MPIGAISLVTGGTYRARKGARDKSTAQGLGRAGLDSTGATSHTHSAAGEGFPPILLPGKGDQSPARSTIIAPAE
jgi:hypothetical protein